MIDEKFSISANIIFTPDTTHFLKPIYESIILVMAEEPHIHLIQRNQAPTEKKCFDFSSVIMDGSLSNESKNIDFTPPVGRSKSHHSIVLNLNKKTF